MIITRFLVLCVSILALVAPISVSAASDKEIVGQWKDDKYSEPLNAGYEIYKADGHYYLHRTNSDGSEGTYPLKKAGSKYIKFDDKFGVYYIVSPKGLKIFDKMGHIRTAKAR